jgi:hypothetical protein
MTAMTVFRDRRVGYLHRLSLKDAQLVVCQEALRRGALTSTELASRSGPARAVRVSVRSPLWATPLGTVYFRSESDATEWARDLLARLPRIEHPKAGARSAVWHLQISAAKVNRSHPTARLSPARVVGGPVLAVLEPDYGPQLRAASSNGAVPAGGAAEEGEERLLDGDGLEELAKAIAAAVAPIAPRWVTATVARVTRARSGNVFLALEGEHTTIDAVVFAGAGAKVGPIPDRGDVIAAHVARVSLYQARGQLSLVVDRLSRPRRGRGG